MSAGVLPPAEGMPEPVQAEDNDTRRTPSLRTKFSACTMGTPTPCYPWNRCRSQHRCADSLTLMCSPLPTLLWRCDPLKRFHDYFPPASHDGSVPHALHYCYHPIAPPFSHSCRCQEHWLFSRIPSVSVLQKEHRDDARAAAAQFPDRLRPPATAAPRPWK